MARTHGTKYIKTPEIMWDLFCEYVEYERSHPMYKREYVGRDGNPVDTPLETPITFEGFECYLQNKGVINDLGDYSSNRNGAYSEYSTILTRIKNNCFVHNLKGASVGLFNASIIAKKLGLIEKQQVEVIEQPLFPEE
jgi:hypothetical protein